MSVRSHCHPYYLVKRIIPQYVNELTHFCQAIRDGLAHDVTDSGSFKPHLLFEGLGLSDLGSDKIVELLLLCDKLVCIFFRLVL